MTEILNHLYEQRKFLNRQIDDQLDKEHRKFMADCEKLSAQLDKENQLGAEQLIRRRQELYQQRLNEFITSREMMLAATGHPASRDAGIYANALKEGSTFDDLIDRLEVLADKVLHAREKLEEVEYRYADFDGKIVLDDKRQKAEHKRELLIRIMAFLPEYVLKRPAPEPSELRIADE